MQSQIWRPLAWQILFYSMLQSSFSHAATPPKVTSDPTLSPKTSTTHAVPPSSSVSNVVAPKKMNLLVVPLHGKAGVAFDRDVGRHVTARLSAKASIVPPSVARKAYLKAHVTPQAALHKYTSAQKLGRAANADHVLFIGWEIRKGKHAAKVVLVNVKTARAVYAEQFALIHRKLDDTVGKRIVESILPKLTPPVVVVEKSITNSETVLAHQHAPGDPTEPAAAEDTEASDGETQSAVKKAAASDHGARWRPGFRFGLPVMFLQRSSTLNPAVAQPNVTPPCYCGSGSNANPLFFAGMFNLELFPVALAGNGNSWSEGLGVHLELFYASVLSTIDTLSQQTTRSNVVGFKGGGQFRYVLWDSPSATDLQLDLGYSIFDFPLSAGPYPSVAFKATYLGLAAHVPLGTPDFAFLLGVHLLLGVKTADSAASWLGTQDGGSGFNLHAGLRYSIKRWEVTALYRFERYSSSFTGSTQLPSSSAPTGVVTPVQFNNVTLRDNLNEIVLQGGVAF